jgi:hypothetical protein
MLATTKWPHLMAGGWFYINIALLVRLLMTIKRVKVVFQGTTCCVLGQPKLYLGTEFKRKVNKEKIYPPHFVQASGL